MRHLIALICIFIAAPAWSATWYVRTDGGTYGTTSTTCNGLTDAAYSAGNGPNCAVDHPFEILGIKDNNPRTQRVGINDTVIIKNSDYKMGYDLTKYSTGNCSSAYAYDCFAAPLPAGLKIYGEEYASGCSTKPVLWGSGGVQSVLTVTSADNVEIKCVEITDHDSCAYRLGADQCTESATTPYGRHGLTMWDSAGVVLQDVHIHGMGYHGIQAGKMENLTMTDVKVIGNGSTGFEQDEIVHKPDNSYPTGTPVTFTRVNISFNGCVEDYPLSSSNYEDTSNYVTCSGGSYGDGLGSPDSGTGGTWTLTDCIFKHNTADGLDLLHFASTVSGNSVTIEGGIYEGNAGNQLKTGGGTQIIRNAQIIGNCNFFVGKTYRGGGTIEDCRAGGDPLVLTMDNGAQVSVVNTTIVGESNYLVLLAGHSACTGAESAVFRNMILQANSTSQSAFGVDSCTGLTPDWDYLTIYNTASSCSGKTRCLTSNPLLTTVNYTTEVFDLSIGAASPVIGQGLSVGTTVGGTTVPSTDYNGYARGASVDFGALEYGSTTSPIRASSGTTAPTTPISCTDPTDGSISITLSVTASTATTQNCRYSTVGPNVTFGSMTSQFSGSPSTTQTATLSLACGSSYTYYVACEDDTQSGDAYPIAFTIEAVGGGNPAATFRGYLKGAFLK